MQSIEKCTSCKSSFDTTICLPLNLPCNHSVCQLCLYTEFKIKRQNKCPQCNKISKLNPTNLTRNQKILCNLQFQERQTGFDAELETLKSCRDILKETLDEISNQQISITQAILRLLNETLFSHSNQAISDLSQHFFTLNQKIISMEHLANLKKHNLKIDSEIQEEPFNLSILEKAQNRGNQEIQKLKCQKRKLVNYIKQLFALVRDFNFDIQSPTMKGTELQDLSFQQESTQQTSKRESDKSESPTLVNAIHFFKSLTSELHFFDVETEKYSVVKIQQQVPLLHKSIEYQNKIYLIGGYCQNKVLQTTWQVDYDGTCTQLSDLNVGRRSFGIAAAKGFIFAVGGRNGEKCLTSTEKLELEGKE